MVFPPLAGWKVTKPISFPLGLLDLERGRRGEEGAKPNISQSSNLDPLSHRKSTGGELNYNWLSV